jgi:hypothetical protein
MKHRKMITGVNLLLAVLVALCLAACKPDSDPNPNPGELVLPPGLYAPDGSRVDVEGLAGALDWIAASGTAGKYTIVLEEAETAISPRTLAAGDGGSITITLKGYGAARAANPLERVIRLTKPGSLFTLNSGVALILGENITLRGRDDNTAPLVVVNSGAVLTINDGAKITGNTFNSGSGDKGGGVEVQGGTLTMTGGEISGNTVTGTGWVSGGGIYIEKGTSSISGGKITGNAVVSTAGGGAGGGIWGVNDSSITMSGGEISGNTVTVVDWAEGGGIDIMGTLKFSGGKISGNAVVSSGGSATGGGINLPHVDNINIVVISGGKISGNSVTAADWADGGGVFINDATDVIMMTGGVISGNTVTSSTLNHARGGGVRVGHATFKKIPASGSTGSGTIYGNDAGANSNRNIDPSGEISEGSHAVWADGLTDIYITVGPGHYLDTTDGTGF